MACRHYVCDALRIITENTAKAVPGGIYLSAKFYDMINNKKEESQTSEEIIANIRKKL